MPYLPRLSVIICTYNRAPFLKDCIHSLLDQNLPKDQYQIVVSDDGSNDNTSEIVRELQSATRSGAEISYAPMSHGGLNAARNNGVKNAKGDVILFFDDDQLAPNDYLKKVADAIAANPDVDGVGGPYRDTEDLALRTCGKCSLAGNTLGNNTRHMAARLLGGNMALKTELFQTVGLFDADISGRGDETEWFARAKGIRFLYDPDLWVWHRRDGFGLVKLCTIAYQQGKAFPIYKKKVGSKFEMKPIKILRFLAHGVLKQCSRGFILASRELGAIAGHLKSNR